jgi:ribosomal protein S18 acetylase RimI-like enzyme
MLEAVVREKVTIRPLRPGDAWAVRNLDRLILGPDRSRSWDSHVERFLTDADVDVLPDAPFGCHLAVWHGKVVGFLLSEFQAGEYGLPRGAWVIAVAVHPEMRRAGVGKALMQALVMQCRERKIEDIFAVVKPGDDRIGDFLSACDMEPSPVIVYGRRV